MLTFQTCADCCESHALKQDGTMSVHDNARGERCPGSVAAKSRPARPAQPRSPTPAQPRSKRSASRADPELPPLPSWLTPAERAEQEALRRARAAKKPTPAPPRSELEAAVAYAAENPRKRRNFGIKNYREPVDRRIYATGRPVFFSGGSPGNGKR